MKRFAFALEKLRSLRRLEMERRAVSVERARNSVAALDARASAIAEESASARRGAIEDGAGFPELGRYEDWALKTRQTLAAERQRSVRLLAGELAQYAAARQRHEILEKLRDRALAAWRREYAREQDELASELFLAKWRPPEREHGSG